MTGKTHRAGGVLCSIIGFTVLYNKGLLLPDVHAGVQWLVMYPFCLWGSLASDLDHNEDCIPMHDIASKTINRVLHLTHTASKGVDKVTTKGQREDNAGYFALNVFNAKHRSWQTHSDLTLYALLYLLHCIMINKFGFTSQYDIYILCLCLMGITLGVIAHFILDMLTPEGVWCIWLILLNKVLQVLFKRKKKVFPEKIHFVPYTKNRFFATGGRWEELVCKVLNISTVIAFIWFIMFFMFPDISAKLPFTISFS